MPAYICYDPLLYKKATYFAYPFHVIKVHKILSYGSIDTIYGSNPFILNY